MALIFLNQGPSKEHPSWVVGPCPHGSRWQHSAVLVQPEAGEDTLIMADNLVSATLANGAPKGLNFI